MTVGLDAEKKTLNIKQELIFINQSSDTLTSIVLNDWNYAFSNKNSALAKRFSDEFYRGFHLAKEEERGSTNNLIITDTDENFISWERTKKNPDYISVQCCGTTQGKVATKSENHFTSFVHLKNSQ